MSRGRTHLIAAALLGVTFGLGLGLDGAALRALGVGGARLGTATAQPAEAPPPPTARRPARKAPAKAKGAVKAKPAPALASEPETPVDPYASPDAAREVPRVTVPPRLGIDNLPAMQGLLAVQRLDGWLLHDRAGKNPIAMRLVAPAYRPQHAWFYLLPVSGEPALVCHVADAAAFEKLAGRKVTYQGDREQQQALRELLKGKTSLAMDLAGHPELPADAKVDDATRELLRTLKIALVSADNLVQYTTAVWGEAGHTSHHVAVHHLVELRKDALAFVAKQLRSGAAVTELQLQQRLARGMVMRGVVGPAPVVAAGVHTADPSYLPTAETAAVIKEGDVVLLGLALRVDQPDAIFAAQTWVAYAGATVPARVTKLFDTVTLARDQSIAFIAERFAKRKPVRGYEVDRVTRGVMAKAGLAAQFVHRAGHSIDTSLDGAGADLDDHERKDTRSLVAGTGVTLAPAAYFPGELGVRSELTLFLSPSGPELTTPPQYEVEALLAP